MNVIGEPIDECGPIGKSPSFCADQSSTCEAYSCSVYLCTLLIFVDTVSDSTLAIHREAPPFVDQSTEMEMLVTGIKVG